MTRTTVVTDLFVAAGVLKVPYHKSKELHGHCTIPRAQQKMSRTRL